MSGVFRVLFCCGSRPELIKISPVYHHMRKRGNILPLVCLTGQHRELLTPHLEYFNLDIHTRLDALHKGQDLDHLMARLFQRLPPVFDDIRPHLVMVQGDTASAFASAIVARKKHYPLAHIEAGLRTYDKRSPFPEEIYRQNISRLSDWHFCPTEEARQNLLSEHIPDSTIFVTGNTAVDVVRDTYARLQKDAPPPALRPDSRRPFFLVTLHRRESQGAPLMRIVDSLKQFADATPSHDLIIPLHANPASSGMIQHRLGGRENIFMTPALPYPHMVRLMADAYAIITDSGGIQEEGSALHTPVVVVRDKTERAEGVAAGCLRLAGTRTDSILSELNLLMTDPAHYSRMTQAPNPFGDGAAAKYITNHVVNILKDSRYHHAP